MSIVWDTKALTALTHSQRHQLWLNARRSGEEDLISMIETSGLPYADLAGVKLDSHLGRAMSTIINSPEGKAAAIHATQQGLPALAGVDPLLKSKLGMQYVKSYEATIQAGYLVAKAMRKAGYEDTGARASLPDGCVAKTGIVFAATSIVQSIES